MDKLGIIKVKNFGASKDIINKVRRQPRDRENTSDHTSDPGFLCRIYKELLQHNNKKTNTSIKMVKKFE